MDGAGVLLDVRTLALRERHERIFAELRALPPDDVLRLVNDHDPKPLWYQLQAEQPGVFTWQYEEQGPEQWRVTIARAGAVAAGAEKGVEPAPAHSIGTRMLDNRGLEPPEPLVRILEALAELDADTALESQLDREPLLLYPHLEARGYAYRTATEADGSVLIRIWREA